MSIIYNSQKENININQNQNLQTIKTQKEKFNKEIENSNKENTQNFANTKTNKRNKRRSIEDLINSKRKSTVSLKEKFFNNKKEENNLTENPNKNTDNTNININPSVEELHENLDSIKNKSYLEDDNFILCKRNSLPIFDNQYNLINYYLNDPEIKINKNVKEYSIEENESKLNKANSQSIISKEKENCENIFPNLEELTDKKPRSILRKSNLYKKKINEISIQEKNIFKNEENEKTKIINIGKLNSDKFIEIPMEIYSQNLENLLINKFNKPEFDSNEIKRILSHLLEKDIGNSIMNNLLEDEKSIDLDTKDNLKSHNISERMRSKIIDWFIEVLINFNCDDITFFITINLMDRVFKKTDDKQLNPADLHLIGITCMFMASKYQDIYPMRLKTVKEKISHNKFSIEEIKQKEIEISKLLNYSITLPNQWEFIGIFTEEIFYNKHNNFMVKNQSLIKNYLQNSYYVNSSDAKKVKFLNIENEEFLNFCEFDYMKYNENFLNLITHLSLYLCKMNCFDCDIMSEKPSLIAASTLIVAVKIAEQINSEVYMSRYLCKKLINLSGYSEQIILNLGKRILFNAQNFEEIFPKLENLKKYHYESILELTNTK